MQPSSSGLNTKKNIFSKGTFFSFYPWWTYVFRARRDRFKACLPNNICKNENKSYIFKLLSKLCFQSTKCHSPQGVAWDLEPPPPLTTSQSRVLDYHTIALIFKCRRNACFGHTARSNDFRAAQRQNSECCKMEIAWNICRLWKNSVRFNNIFCRITSWHAASHVVSGKHDFFKSFTSIHRKTTSWLPNFSLTLQTLGYHFNIKKYF